MSKHITPRDAFKLAWRKARQLKKVNPSIKAFFVAEAATDHCIYAGDYDYEPFLAIDKAVLWAIHWMFEEPREDLPRWYSERHLCFELGPNESRVWFQAPRLPS